LSGFVGLLLCASPGVKIRRLDASGCPLLVGDRRAAAMEAAALANAGRKGGARPGTATSHRSSMGSVAGAEALASARVGGGTARGSSTARSAASAGKAMATVRTNAATVAGMATGRTAKSGKSGKSGKGRSKKKGPSGPVNWEKVAKSRPYCRAAPQGKGLAAAPDADALAWRDAYVERCARTRRCRWSACKIQRPHRSPLALYMPPLCDRLALEVRACRKVINTYRSFKFRRVYVVRHAAFVLTRCQHRASRAAEPLPSFLRGVRAHSLSPCLTCTPRYWRTMNLGILRVIRLWKRTVKRRRLKRQFFLNTLSLYNACRYLQRLLRGCVHRKRAAARALRINGAATSIQRCLRRHWDWLKYFREMAVAKLEDVLDDER